MNNEFVFLSETEANTNSEAESGSLENGSQELTEEITDATMNFRIDGQAFVDSLPIMGKGMLGIFLVTAVIVITVAILNKVTGRKKKSENNES